jgi:hypothetical protein
MGEVVVEEAPFPLTDVDRWVLSQTDEEFKKHDWDELRVIIGMCCCVLDSSGTFLILNLATNNLSILKRKPSDLRRYMKWTSETKAEYGSMTQYLLTHRLPKTWGMPPFVPKSATPFEDPSDYRVLLNDWPYGLSPSITHIVVWSRTIIPTDAETGDMTPSSRSIVEEFVKRYFADSLGPDGDRQVMWFKNWVALQSVRTLEHVHVMVQGVDKETLLEWTDERPWHRQE